MVVRYRYEHGCVRPASYLGREIEFELKHVDLHTRKNHDTVGATGFAFTYGRGEEFRARTTRQKIIGCDEVERASIIKEPNIVLFVRSENTQEFYDTFSTVVQHCQH